MPRSTMLVEPLNLRSGQVIDRYELLLPIASSSGWETWAARLRGARGFAKLVRLQLTTLSGGEAGNRAREIWKRAELVARAQHPNLVQYFEFLEHQGGLCASSEWIPGETLGSVLREAADPGRRMAIGVATQVVLQACKGVQAMHRGFDGDGRSAGWVHGDLSPDTLMLDVTGTVKVLAPFSSSGHANGGVMDARDDVSSLGAMLYLLTTGRPCQGVAPDSASFVSPSALVDEYPVKLERLLVHALARDPRQRFQSAAELYTELVTAFPGHAGEEELGAFLRSVCGGALARREALLGDVARRTLTQASATTEREAPGGAIIDTLAPALLNPDTYPKMATPSWAPGRFAAVTALCAFAVGFGWTVGRPWSRTDPGRVGKDAVVERERASAAGARAPVEPKTHAPPALGLGAERVPPPAARASSAIPVLPASGVPERRSNPATLKKAKPLSVLDRYGI